MYLSRFGVKNYKCLADVDIPLTPIHVLIGQNDAGKTSLLEAMAAFCASATTSLPEVFPEPWEGRELIRHGAQEPRVQFDTSWSAVADQEITSWDSELRYGFSVAFPVQGRDLKCVEEVAVVGGETVSLSLATGAHARTSLNKRNLGAGGPNPILAELDNLSTVVKPARMHSFNARLMAIPAAFDTDRKFSLDFDGFGLATLLDDILGHDVDRFIQLRTEFCRHFPQFKNVRLELTSGVRRFEPDGIRSDEASGKGIYFESQSGQTIRAQQASDGAVLFLGFLALAHIPDPPNLLLIEEPENGIYPKRLGEVITLLKELVNRTEGVRFPQIIMTTHSPYVLSFFEPEEVTFLSRTSEKPDAPVRARPLRDAPNIHQRLGGEFYLGELWYNLSEEELFRDG